MKPLKICFVTREYAHKNMGNSAGGIGVFLKQFSKQLKEYNFSITVFSFGINSVQFNDDGISILKIKDLTRINEAIKAPLRKYKVPGYLKIKQILEFFNRIYISLYLSIYVFRKKFDLVEFHDFGGDACYFLGKTPKIVRCHGSALTLHKFMGYSKNRAFTAFEERFFKRFNKHVIAVSKFSAEITQKAFRLKQFPKVIYNGVEIQESDPCLDNYLDLPTVPKSIYYFGSVRERKGINVACKVFNDLIEIYPEASFHVLGNNNYKHWEKSAYPLLSKKAKKQTTYYGPVPNHLIYEHLKKAHIVVFPSFGENFSIALLEVLAIGKLVVTSSIPAFKEIINHNQNGFIAEDYEDYMSHISSIFNGEIDQNAIAHNAYQTIKEHFNSKTIIQENINYYKSLL